MKTSNVDPQKEARHNLGSDLAGPIYDGARPVSREADKLTDRLDNQTPTGPKTASVATGLLPPSSGSSSSINDRLPGDINTSIDVEKASLIARVRALRTLDAAKDAADRIAELHGKPRHADEVHAMADRLVYDEKERGLVKLAASLVVLGEWKSPAELMLGGRLNDDQKRAHIFPINSRAAEVLGTVGDADAKAVAAAIDGKDAYGITPWFHACRDISAMDAPRHWRRDEKHPDGRLSFDEIASELEKNNARPGRDGDVTAEILARYRSLRAG